MLLYANTLYSGGIGLIPSFIDIIQLIPIKLDQMHLLLKVPNCFSKSNPINHYFFLISTNSDFPAARLHLLSRSTYYCLCFPTIRDASVGSALSRHVSQHSQASVVVVNSNT